MIKHTTSYYYWIWEICKSWGKREWEGEREREREEQADRPEVERRGNFHRATLTQVMKIIILNSI